MLSGSWFITACKASVVLLIICFNCWHNSAVPCCKMWEHIFEWLFPNCNASYGNLWVWRGFLFVAAVKLIDWFVQWLSCSHRHVRFPNCWYYCYNGEHIYIWWALKAGFDVFGGCAYCFWLLALILHQVHFPILMPITNILAVYESESDVTYGQVWWPILWIRALHLNHPKCTHTAVNTHTPWTHTRSIGQPFMLQRPGSIWGFGALLKGTSVVVLREERVLYIHSPHLQFLPARDSNSQPLGYKSLTIRPRLPPLTFY